MRLFERVSSAWLRPSIMACIVVAALCGEHANAAKLGEILKRNELVICAHVDALPYTRRGTPEGIQIELGKALAEELGVSLRVHFMRMHREPRRRECDALMSVAIPRQDSDDDETLRSIGYMAYRPVLVMQQSAPTIDSLEKFAPGRVGVQSGTWAHFLLTQRNIPVWVRFRTEEEIIAAVESGDAAAGIVSNFSFGWYLKNHPQAKLRESTHIVLDEDLGFDVAVGLMDADQALLDRVNTGVASMREKGIIASTLKRYGIELEQPTRMGRAAAQ